MLILLFYKAILYLKYLNYFLLKIQEIVFKMYKSSGYDKLVAQMIKRLDIITIKQLTAILNDTINNNLPHQLGLDIFYQTKNPINKKL